MRSIVFFISLKVKCKSCWNYNFPCLITHINSFHHILRDTYEFFSDVLLLVIVTIHFQLYAFFHCFTTKQKFSECMPSYKLQSFLLVGLQCYKLQVDECVGWVVS